MKWIRAAIFSALISYSLSLIFIEFRYSQDVVRNFFSDINGALPFYGINTTFSVALLWGTALLFGVCLLLRRGEPDTHHERLFYLSQLITFAYLGFDDRFLFHETIGNLFDFEDEFVLLAIGGVELFLLFFLGQFSRMQIHIRRPLIIAAILFGLMIFIDAFLPSRLFLRLSVEDLLKFWANIFIFMFAWKLCNAEIEQIKSS